MLEKPELQDEKIIDCIKDEYGLTIDQVAFLPIGADLNTAVYCVVTTDKTRYFLKLRRGLFDETSVTLPKFLSEQGVKQIIAPLSAKNGQLWAILDTYKAILYPFIEGRNGYEIDLLDRHWVEFGAALKRVHIANLPAALTSRIRRENYSPHGREIVRAFLRRVDNELFDEAIASESAAFLKGRCDEILELVRRAERFAGVLQAQALESVLCHSDAHAGNILIGANDALYIVDWDEPILAPKERDLMFVGGAQGFRGHTAEQEKILFYQGYGQTPIDPVALSYYRYERIVQDIAVECQQIFSANGNGEDRKQEFEYLKSNFLPGHAIENAWKTDKTQQNL
jgi:spectinomycin phosphotransferase